MVVGLFTVKEAILTNEKLRQVITRQESVVSNQLTRMTCLQQELTSTRSSLSELRAERQCRDVEFEHLINSLRLDLHSVSTQHSSHLSLHCTLVYSSVSCYASKHTLTHSTYLCEL